MGSFITLGVLSTGLELAQWYALGWVELFSINARVGYGAILDCRKG